MEYMKIMKRNNLLLLVLGAVFSFSAQAGTLSRNLTDQEFSVVVPSQENASPDRSKVYRDALNGLAEKLSGGVYETATEKIRRVDPVRGVIQLDRKVTVGGSYMEIPIADILDFHTGTVLLCNFSQGDGSPVQLFTRPLPSRHQR